ncbi:MAG: hypothetical protein AAB401_19715 [Acidobacteriota bacterium]
MSKRLTDREKLFHKLQQMTDIEVEDVLDYVSLLERDKFRQSERMAMKDKRTSQSSPASDDELLALLSSAYENRRACQVFEWEAVRRKSEIKAGSYAR